MLKIAGFLVVIGSVLGGFLASGGHIGALWHPFEILIIGGAAFGAFMVANSALCPPATWRRMSWKPCSMWRFPA